MDCFSIIVIIAIITMIMFFIIVISLLVCWVTDEKIPLKTKTTLEMSALVCSIPTIIFILCTFFPTFFFGHVVVKVQYRYNISAVEDNRDIAGRFGRSIYYTRGYVEQNLYYYVVRLNDGYKTVQKIPANKTRIIESNDETPRVVYYGEYFEKTNESVGNNFRFNKDYYELYVPDNTVTDSWNIDMNG